MMPAPIAVKQPAATTSTGRRVESVKNCRSQSSRLCGSSSRRSGSRSVTPASDRRSVARHGRSFAITSAPSLATPSTNSARVRAGGVRISQLTPSAPKRRGGVEQRADGGSSFAP